MFYTFNILTECKCLKYTKQISNLKVQNIFFRLLNMHFLRSGQAVELTLVLIIFLNLTERPPKPKIIIE